MEKELPIGWILIKVVDISEIVRGITYQKSDASTTKFDNSCLVLRGGNIHDGKIVIEDDCVYVPDSIVKKDQKLRRGDVIIVGSTGSAKLIGKAAFSLSDEEEISFGAFLVMLRPDKKIESWYFDYFFLTEFYRTEIRELAGGININNIRREHLEGIDFPLPPLPEQQRIVAKLDNLFGHLDALKTCLDRIPQQLKDFRQKVLTQAVTGKLTEEWRKGKELEEWKIEIASKCCDKVQSGGTPKGGGFTDEGIPFLKVYNIVNNQIDFEYRPQFVTIEVQNKALSKSIAYPGDVLMNIVGPPLNKIAILPADYPEWNLNQAITLFRTKKYLLNTFLYYFFCEGKSVREVMGETKGVVGQVNISLSQCREFEIPVPPLQEQQEIIHRVESLFAKADQIEASYQKLKAKIEQLPQALLAKAFSGELVAQHPTDGDARELLEQIKQAKAGLEKGGRSRNMKAVNEVRMVAELKVRYGK
jgi:type I restriction enzyme S subunit